LVELSSGKFIIFIIGGIVVFLLFALYCCLISSKRADEEMEQMNKEKKEENEMEYSPDEKEVEGNMLMSKQVETVQDNLFKLLSLPKEEEEILKSFLKESAMFQLLEDYPILGLSIETEKKLETLGILVSYDGRRENG